MSTKHTPGPWYYDKLDKLNPLRAFGIVAKLGPVFDAEAGTEGATQVIAEVCDADGSIAKADARLIAASPRMLAALEGLFEHCAMMHKHWGEGSNQKEADAAIAEAQAVMAEARGE